MSWIETLRQALGLAAPPPLTDKRSRLRLSCALPVKLSVDGKVVSGRTRDVNSQGATIRLAHPLKRGQPVEVMLLNSATPPAAVRFQGRVVWSRREPEGEAHVGLEFTGWEAHSAGEIMTWLRQELALPVLDDRQKRTFRRISTNWPADYAVPGREHRLAMVKDVSPTGCLLLSRYPLLMWTDISLNLRPDTVALPIQAQAVVRRCTRLPGADWWEIGCPFVEIRDGDRQRLVAAIEKQLQSSTRRTKVDTG